jgi:pyruvate dehydrogenase E1 component alpha subunit
MAVMDGQVKKPELSKSLGLQLYQTMTRIRTFEDKIRDLNTAGELEGYIHLAVGQEGVDAGVCANLGRTDALFTSFRNHGQCIAKGLEIDAMMAEMFGRSTGTNRGKGGSMHLADHSRYMFGGNGIVGSSPPLALGPALTSKVRGTKEVSVSFFGEGAAQQGTTHEAMNLASIWKLPVIFVCTNNFYAQSTPVTYSSAVHDISARGEAYGMPGVMVDGQDVVQVYEVASEAVDRARSGQGPTLIEAKTFLFYGAWEGEHPDSKNYRSKELEAQFLARDPIQLLAQQLIGRGWAADSDLEAIRQAAVREIEAAVDFARGSAKPSPEDALKDVYVSYA